MAKKTSSVALETYKGILVLDDTGQVSFLRQKDSAGQSSDTLMMRDSSPSGDFTPAKVTAAFQLFSEDPGVDNGDTITVFGFCNYPPHASFPVLHVSSYKVGV